MMKYDWTGESTRRYQRMRLATMTIFGLLALALPLITIARPFLF
jgi:hypothetical protein